jgi:hypothetical protein
VRDKGEAMFNGYALSYFIRAIRSRLPALAAACVALTPFLLIAAIMAPVSPAAAGQRHGTTHADDASSWWDRTPFGDSRHYRIKTDLPADEARELARHLDRIHDAMHNRLGSLPARRPVTNLVLVFQHYEDYLYTLRSRFGINAIGTGGVFFVRPEGAAIAVWIGHRPRQRILAVLQHEAFHQFAYSRFGGDLPVWANEGLAMFFEEAVLIGRELIIGQAQPRLIESVQTAIEQERTIPFRDILLMDSQRWQEAILAGSASVQYNQSWSIVHFIIYGDGGRYVHAFERYLRLINDGVLADRAFLQAFDTERYDLIEAAWKRYMMEDVAPSAFVAALERIEFLAEGLLELSRRGVFKVDDESDAGADSDGDRPRRGRAGAPSRAGPTTFEELQKALISIDFTVTISVHGATSELSAQDAELFNIPSEEETAGGRKRGHQRPRGGRAGRDQPEFVLTEPRLRLRSHRERLRERENPTPPIIETRNLSPYNLRIEWQRDEETGKFSYEIVVR